MDNNIQLDKHELVLLQLRAQQAGQQNVIILETVDYSYIGTVKVKGVK